MNIFLNVFRLSFLLLVLSITACGENLSEETSNNNVNDSDTNEDVATDYGFIISDETLITTSPEGTDTDDLSYQWLMYGEIVAESATFDTSIYDNVYTGEHTVTLLISDLSTTHVHSEVVDFGVGSASEYSFTREEDLLVAAPPSSIDTSDLTYQWLIDGEIISEDSTYDISASSYSGEQKVVLITYVTTAFPEETSSYYASKDIDFSSAATNQSPIADFTFSNETLTATSTDDAGSEYLIHEWFADDQSLGNGTTLDTSGFTGTLSITLTSTDANDLSDSKTESIYFGSPIPVNSSPVAIATSDVTSGNIPLMVAFDASTSSDNEDTTLTYLWNFSDGTSSELVTPSKTFTSAGNYTATLTVTDSENASTTADIINITATSPQVDLPPVADIDNNVSSGEVPLTVNFDASGASDDNSISSYSWDFGDGTTSSSATVSHTYSEVNTYIATLTVTDNAGQSTQTTTQIIVEPIPDLAPVAEFTINETTGEAPFAATFNASGSSDDNAIASYNWNFGDGSTSSGVTASHTYLDANTYTITLTVTDNAGQSTQSTKNITVEAADLAPIALFTATTTAGEAPLIASFDASTSSDDNTISSYSWNFGDGSTSSGVTTSHTYAEAGNYSVTLTVIDNAGNSSQSTKDITVEGADLLPVALFTTSVATGEAPLAISFDASDSSDDTNISTYGWDFGDGSTSSGMTVSHTYTEAGIYTATLTVTDNAGQSSQVTKEVTVEGADLLPVALFTTSVATGEAPLAISFDASDSSDDTNISTYGWDFGDGSTSSGMTVSHTYTEAGIYTATLTVTDNAGQSSQVTKDITVEAIDDSAPIALFTISVTTGNAPLLVNFDASDSSDDINISTYDWNFGDGSTSSGITISHTYTAADTYTVTLTVTDDAGQSTQLTKQVTVEEAIDIAPVASFTVSAITGDAPLITSFDASASTDDNEITSYSWDFGDGSSLASGVTSTYTYTAAGIYTATLTITDGSNQTHSVTQAIEVTTAAVAPTANFTSSISELSVTVDATASTDADGNDLAYAWTFEDETGATVHTATGVTAIYDFATAGTKSITLVVTDADLLTDTSTKTVTLTTEDETTDPVNGDGTIIFSEDYEDQTVGENPAGWGVNIAYNIQLTPDATAYSDKVRVVNDAPGRDGKALYVDGTGLNSSQNYSIMPLDLSIVDNVERVYVRYYVYASTNYIGNRALTPSGAQPNHNHFMSLGLSHSAEMRIGEIKGALGANEYGGDDIVPKDEYWYGKIETSRMEAGTWYCVESAFINDGDTPVLRTWLDDVLITEIDEASDWKNGTARDNWLDGFFGGVQLGWGNFGTYDNELYFDDVVASNERIGCDASLTEPAPTLTPSFEITEESMVVTVNGNASTGTEDFTYEWDFDGESTDTTSGSNASYTFTTTGDKTISLTLISGNTTETISQTITIVDTTYDDLLTSLSANIVAHCIACHSPEDDKPIVFESSDPVDVEAGMSTYIINNSAQQLIDTPNGADSHSNIIPTSSEQDWEDLVYLIEAKFNGEDDSSSGDVGDGNIFINDDFEGQDADSVPEGWQTFLSYQIDMFNNNASNNTFALIDSSIAHSGSNSIRIKTTGNAIDPAFIFQDLPIDQDAFYSRAWMYIPTVLGGGIKGADGNHAHFMSYSTEMSGSNKEELRYGTIQDGILGAFLPSSIDAGTENIVPTTEIPANEWVCVEFAMIKGTVFDQTTGWVNGQEIFDATSASDWARDPGQFFSDDTAIANHVTFGWRAFGDNKGVENIWFDDIVVSDQYIGCN